MAISSLHRRRRWGGAPAGDGRRADRAAGHRRARQAGRARRPRLAAVNRADAARRARGDGGHRQRAQRRSAGRAHSRGQVPGTTKETAREPRRDAGRGAGQGGPPRGRARRAERPRPQGPVGALVSVQRPFLRRASGAAPGRYASVSEHHQASARSGSRRARIVVATQSGAAAGGLVQLDVRAQAVEVPHAAVGRKVTSTRIAASASMAWEPSVSSWCGTRGGAARSVRRERGAERVLIREGQRRAGARAAAREGEPRSAPAR